MSDTPDRLRLFSLEGREAPALYLVGLLAAALGGAGLVAGVMGAGLPLATVGLFTLGIAGLALAGASALQRRVDTPASGWRGPGPIALFLATLPWSIVAPVPLVLLVTLVGGRDAMEPAVSTMLQALLGNFAVVGVIAVTVVGTGAATWRDLTLPTTAASSPLLPRPDRRGGVVGDIAWGVVVALPILGTAALVATTLVQSTGAVPPSPLPPSHSLLPLIANIVTAGVIAPLGEELLYRGVIAQAWGRQRGPRQAVLYSALLFAFVHTLALGGTSLSNGVLVAVVAFATRLPIGVALGWLWVRRRSLLAVVVLHAAYNLALVFAAAS